MVITSLFYINIYKFHINPPLVSLLLQQAFRLNESTDATMVITAAKQPTGIMIYHVMFCPVRI